MALKPLPRPLFIQQASDHFWNKKWCIGQARYLLWYETPLTRQQKKRIRNMLCCVEGVSGVKADNKHHKFFLIAIGHAYFPEMVRNKLVVLFEPILRHEGTGKIQQKTHPQNQTHLFELTLQVNDLLDEDTWSDILTRLRKFLQCDSLERHIDTITFYIDTRTEIEALTVLCALSRHINLHLHNVDYGTHTTTPNS